MQAESWLFVRVSDKVRKLLVMTRLDSVFKIHGAVADAIVHFNA
jgi:hypothetical protein